MSDEGLVESLEREMRELEYALSHDLRAPLRTVLGFSAMLVEDYGEALDEDGQDLLERIARASRQMRGMLDALLYLSRKTRAPLEPRAVDLGAVALTRAARLDEPLRLEVEGDLRVEGDEALLGEMLWALLENSARFNPGGQAWLRALGEGVYELRDDGPGCDAGFAEKAFEPFSREDPSHPAAGIGMGLTLARRAIHRHRGSVWIEPMEAGFCVRFRLPKA